MKSIFKTNKTESLKTRFYRYRFNFFPAYRRTGGRICFISGDWKEVHISLPMNWKTKNRVGSIFGGSIYGALDPIYMTQLVMILGRDYIVWDKAASIKFIKPVRSKVFARFLITDKILKEIKGRIKSEQKYVIDLDAVFQDESGIVYAEVIKKLYIAEKNYYNMHKRQTF